MSVPNATDVDAIIDELEVLDLMPPCDWFSEHDEVPPATHVLLSECALCGNVQYLACMAHANQMVGGFRGSSGIFHLVDDGRIIYMRVEPIRKGM